MEPTFGSDLTDSGNESISGFLHIVSVIGEFLQEAFLHQCSANVDYHPDKVREKAGDCVCGPVAEEGAEEEEKLESRGRVADDCVRAFGLYLLVAEIRG